jgi:hypothetical protein
MDKARRVQVAAFGKAAKRTGFHRGEFHENGARFWGTARGGPPEMRLTLEAPRQTSEDSLSRGLIVYDRAAEPKQKPAGRKRAGSFPSSLCPREAGELEKGVAEEIKADCQSTERSGSGLLAGENHSAL